MPRDPREADLRLDSTDEMRLERLARHRERAQSLKDRGHTMDPDPDAAAERLGLEVDAPIHLPDVEKSAEDDVLAAAEHDPDLDVLDRVRGLESKLDEVLE